MTPTEYVKNVLKTESRILRLMLDGREVRLLHAAMGIATESGEILDALKKHYFYGKPLDEVNLAEELGDLLWYVGVAVDALGLSFEQIFAINIAKLKARYGEKFSETAALKRDLATEREILERGRSDRS